MATPNEGLTTRGPPPSAPISTLISIPKMPHDFFLPAGSAAADQHCMEMACKLL